MVFPGNLLVSFNRPGECVIILSTTAFMLCMFQISSLLSGDLDDSLISLQFKFEDLKFSLGYNRT